ncbi:hypothetical protein KA005_22195 [bacterium]|nr:hypothetical protein [bacterium]
MHTPRANDMISLILKWASKYKFSSRSVPIALFILSLLVYVFNIHKLGFYWDDWPWLWISHHSGPMGMLSIDRLQRPFAGVILWFGSILAGESPLAWQSISLVLRWFSGFSFWWFLKLLWKPDLERSVWAAFLLLVYPGFTQQYVSVNSSRHIFPLALIFISFGFLILALNTKGKYWLFTGIAIILACITFLSTEYYFGYEIIRPFVIWLVIKNRFSSGREKIIKTLKYWAPYISILMVLFLRRYLISLQTSYDVVLGKGDIRQQLAEIINIIRVIAIQIYDAIVTVWVIVHKWSLITTISPKERIFYIIVIIIVCLFSLYYLNSLKKDNEGNQYYKQALSLGFLFLVIGSIPFIVAGIPLGLDFPLDRTILPMMPGASLFIVGVVDLVTKRRLTKIAIISILVTIATGSQIITAISYVNDWENQESFFRQLTWRIPGIEEGTSIVYQYTKSLQGFHSTANSLTAPINWIYAPGFSGDDDLPYYLFDLRQSDDLLDSLKNGNRLQEKYGKINFHGQDGGVIVVQFDPSVCLHVLLPQYNRLYPDLPVHLGRAVRYSNPNVIELQPNKPAYVPSEIFGYDEPDDWCYFYQKAELALQKKDWQEVADIGDNVFKSNLTPKHPIEILPFIHAYGMVNQWEKAEELTYLTKNLDEDSVPILCEIWKILKNETQDIKNKDLMVNQVLLDLECTAGSD